MYARSHYIATFVSHRICIFVMDIRKTIVVARAFRVFHERDKKTFSRLIYDINLNRITHHTVMQIIIKAVLCRQKTNKETYGDVLCRFHCPWIYCKAIKNKKHVSFYSCFLTRLKG